MIDFLKRGVIGSTGVRAWAVSALAFLALGPAAAQEALYFPAESYGSANKSFSESSINQKQLEVLMAKQDVFETVWDMDERDLLRRAGRAVGMLDLLVRTPDGRLVNSTCTANLIAPNRAITNYHCVPGLNFTTQEAQLRLGFLDRTRAPGTAYRVRLPAIEANRALDYAIIAVEGVPADQYPPLRFSAAAARDRQSFSIIHHPAGQPQRLTRLRCQAGTPPIQSGGDLVHHCDTLGGSSGALLLTLERETVAGLHKAGVPDPVRPFNLATPAAKLYAASAELRRLFPQVAPGAGRVAEVAKPPPVIVRGPDLAPGGAAVRPATARTPAGTVIRDCETCPEMVVIPAGSFMMGSPAGEGGNNERPRRRVAIPAPLAVGRFEVMFDEWDACVGDGGCDYRPADQGWGRGRRPVINVSWNDAQVYLRWLSQKTGRQYRLLSESEWEYAARAGTTTKYAFGDTITSSQARFGNLFGRTVTVGQYAPNAFGLYDMHGNVNEWVEDCYVNTYSGAPVNGSAAATSGCSSRVFRGGSWFGSPSFLRSAIRNGITPSYRNESIGFRLSRPL